LVQAYRYATLFVTASLAESGNLTLAEALVSGTPVVAPDRGYARDLGGELFEYFDPLDPASLAETIAGLLENRDRREDLARRGLVHATQARARQPYDRLIEELTALT
jgi:glycosyltransferase involved in cell wall biosynthesis